MNQWPAWVHVALHNAMQDGQPHMVNVIFRGPIVRLLIDGTEIRPPRAGV